MALGDKITVIENGIEITQTEGEASIRNGNGEIVGRHKVISEQRKHPDGHIDVTVKVPAFGT